MSFTLHAPDIRVFIEDGALPGGLAAWGDGALEVVFDGGVSLGEFFDIAERMSSSGPGSDTNVGAVRDSLRDFGARIKEWSITGVAPGSVGYMGLPYPLALAIFRAWQKAATPDPTSSVPSSNGVPYPAVPALTGA